MDFIKIVILAVAGAGKTRKIVEMLNQNQRFLILTYAIKNEENIRELVIGKFGFFPTNVILSTYFSFLFNFCIRPFDIPCGAGEVVGLNFDERPSSYLKGYARYVDASGRIYASRAYDFVKECKFKTKIAQHIIKFFDYVIIDEVQDFAGYDFDFIEDLGSWKINTLLVGDFFQHTFDTSRDGTKNKGLHQSFECYKKRLARYFTIDEKSLSTSYRCSRGVCDFVRRCLDISIFPNSKNSLDNPPRLLVDEDEITRVIRDPTIVKLFFRESYKYDCRGENWGACKGVTYENVCVVLNKTTYMKYTEGHLKGLAPSTKNKFYVACTRPSKTLFFVEEARLEKFKKP